MRPRVKPHLAFVPLDSENVLVRGAGVFLRYGGEAVPVLLRMLPHLDGTRDADAIAQATGDAPQDVRDILDGLTADRLVEDAAADETPRAPAAAEQLAVWSHLSGRPATAQNRVAAARVLVVGEGALADAAIHALRAAGVGHIARGAEAATGHTHVLVCADAPDPRTFLRHNERILALDAPATFACLDGLDATLGPTVLAGQTPCWRCYDLRAKGAHPHMQRLVAFEAAGVRATSPSLPSFAAIAGAWVAQAIVLTLSGATLPPLAGHVARISFLDLDARRHRVLRLPRCPACSAAPIPDVDRYAPEGPAL